MSKREQILEAVSQVVVTEGIQQVTLEKVAAMAGVSKGGLLYHFPTKDALIQGLLEHFLGDFEAHLAQHVSEGTWLEAFVWATFDTLKPSAAAASAALTAIAYDPNLKTILRSHYQGWYEQAIADGTPPRLVHLIIAATDGVWFSDVLGLNLLDETELDNLKQTLLDLIEDADRWNT